MAKPFLTACIASRGFGSYRTMASLLEELEPYPHSFAFAIGLEIPAAQNECVRKALADPRTDVCLFVEDDNLLGPGFLDAMLAMLSDEMPVVGIDYQLRNGPRCVIRNERDGEVELIGLGVTAIKRSLFDLLPHPPFAVGNRMTWESGGWRDTGIPEHAGGQDVYFCRNVRALGKRIGAVPGLEAGHIELVRGGRHENYGMDVERCWGGVGLPWYPQPKERTVAVELWKSPSGHTVLDLDPDAGAEIEFWRAQGWVRVSANEAKPIQKLQAKRDAERLRRALIPPDEEQPDE